MKQVNDEYKAPTGPTSIGSQLVHLYAKFEHDIREDRSLLAFALLTILHADDCRIDDALEPIIVGDRLPTL